MRREAGALLPLAAGFDAADILSMTGLSAWSRRLAAVSALDAAEIALLDQLSLHARVYPSHDGLVKAGDPSEQVLVVLEGIACEYRMLRDGRRQILAYLFPGDMTDPRQLLLPRWNHALSVLCSARVATLSTDCVQQLERHAGIAQALARYSVVKQSIAREWLVNVGNRSAFERISHLLCEIYLRLQPVGRAMGKSFELPLTQSELADTLALSAVHVNRTLMDLRRLGLVTVQSRHATIHDFAALCSAAGFQPSYLQFERAADSG